MFESVVAKTIAHFHDCQVRHGISYVNDFYEISAKKDPNFCANFYLCCRKITAMKKETLSSMSARTGYSITTISRVLSGQAEKYRISKATVDAIKAEAEHCNYTPSLAAQSLRTKKTGLIGLLLPSVSNPYFSEMASSVISENYKRGYTTIVVETGESSERLGETARDLVARNVEGIIVVPCGEDPQLLERLNASVPVVLVDRHYAGTKLSFVTTNNYQGGLSGTRLLVNSGHKKIVCLQGVKSSMPNQERVKGYLDAMEESHNQQYINVVGSEFSIQSGYLETKILLSGNNRPTAIFALSNMILLGVMKAVNEAGLSIPDDISVVSFDNNTYLDYVTPVMTRVSQPVEDMAVLASKILYDHICGANACSQLRLSPAMIVGESIKDIR